MKKRKVKGPLAKKTIAGRSTVRVVRDNVLGRRPGRSDPLGEQPGTVEKNAPLDVVKGKGAT